jgi:hypothetical protein
VAVVWLQCPYFVVYIVSDRSDASFVANLVRRMPPTLAGFPKVDRPSRPKRNAARSANCRTYIEQLAGAAGMKIIQQIIQDAGRMSKHAWLS